MKKNTTFILLGVAALGAYFYFKRQSDSSAKELPEGAPEASEGDAAAKPDAVVTAPAGQFNEALDKAQQIATTIKDAAVIVKSGTKTAVVKSGKKKKKKTKCPKLSAEQLQNLCKGLKGKELRACRKKNRRSCIIVPPLQTMKDGQWVEQKDDSNA